MFDLRPTDKDGVNVTPKIDAVPSHATSLVLAEEQSLCKIVPTKDEVRKFQSSHQAQKIPEPRYETQPTDPIIQCSTIGSTYMATTSLLSGPVFQSNAHVAVPQIINPIQGSGSSSGSSEPQGVAYLDGPETSEKEADRLLGHSEISQNNEIARSQATPVDFRISYNAVPPANGSTSIMDIDSSKPNVAEKVRRNKKYNPDLFFKVNGKMYQKLGKTGSGGSSEVYKVITSDCIIYALKRIKLKGRDYPTAYGFCQEIEYLNKFKGRKNIIQLIDYEVTSQQSNIK